MSLSSIPILTLLLVLMIKEYTLATDMPKQRGITTIPGPTSRKDKIAIVGAGPSGIHMAYKLIGAGFKKVTIFESSDYIGGKGRSVYHQRVVHDMGACCSNADYSEYNKLIDEFDAGELRCIPSYDIVLNNRRKRRQGILQYVLKVVKTLNPALLDTFERIAYIDAAIQKYIALHTDLFGTYEGVLMPRPTTRVLSTLNITLLDLLKEHDLEVLRPVFVQSLTSRGLGNVDEISSLYGLMLMTPSFLFQVFYPPIIKNNKILSKGNQHLWEEIAKQLSMDVRLSSPVKRIVRSKGPKRIFHIFYDTASGKTQQEDFDFLILTSSMKSFTNIINFNKKERTLFERTSSVFLTVSMVNGRYRKSPLRSLYIDTKQSKVENQVVVQHYSKGLLNYATGGKCTTKMLPSGPDEENKLSPVYQHLTNVYYQLSTTYPRKESLKSKLRQHIKNFENGEFAGIQEQIVWSHFPRYSVSDMSKGVLWDILDMQGKYGMWYIGSSVSFDTLQSVLQYNNLLFQRYDAPSIS